jgi:hypothetical protein
LHFSPEAADIAQEILCIGIWLPKPQPQFQPMPRGDARLVCAVACAPWFPRRGFFKRAANNRAAQARAGLSLDGQCQSSVHAGHGDNFVAPWQFWPKAQVGLTRPRVPFFS